jgi:hypothetical protein
MFGSWCKGGQRIIGCKHKLGCCAGITADTADICIGVASVHAQPFVLRQWLHSLGRPRREQVLAEVMGLLQSGVIRPYSGGCMPACAATCWHALVLFCTAAPAYMMHYGMMMTGALCPAAGKVFRLENVRLAAAESVREGRGGKVFLAG